MKKIGLVVKSDARAVAKADELEQWLRSKNVTVIRKTPVSPGRRNTETAFSSAPADLFCVFVLGGDGTFLSAARWIGNHRTPVLGIKFGEIGFLAEIVEDSLYAAAERVLRGDFAVTPRMRLDVTVQRDGNQLARETVLNDIVINKGALARLASIRTHVNDHYLTTYRADGLIVATPTGSTAYSLAAGGPVIHPAVPAIIMTPICPFTLTNRPLILPDTVRIAIRLEKAAADIVLTFDGQQGMDISDRDTIVIKKGTHPLNTISLPDRNYFDILKAKLRWSGGRV